MNLFPMMNVMIIYCNRVLINIKNIFLTHVTFIFHRTKYEFYIYLLLSTCCVWLEQNGCIILTILRLLSMQNCVFFHEMPKFKLYSCTYISYKWQKTFGKAYKNSKIYQENNGMFLRIKEI